VPLSFLLIKPALISDFDVLTTVFVNLYLPGYFAYKIFSWLALVIWGAYQGKIYSAKQRPVCGFGLFSLSH
jgi:hypothetical protein